ncbi:MAG: cell division protein FtsQ/DivIB [Alkalispirochaetaceae bacterium]
MAELILGGRKRKFKARSREKGGAVPERTPATRFLVGVAVALALLMGAEMLFHLLLASRFRITRVVVESDLPVSDSELLRMARIRGDELYFSLDPGKVAESLEEYPPIAKAVVEKSFPDTLEISIDRRKPVAALFAPGGEPTLLHVDSEGAVFAPVSRRMMSDLPIVSGVQEELSPGARLPEYVESVLSSVQELKLHRPELYRMISEYEIVPQEGMFYDVVLYPMPFRTPVRVSTSFTAEECGYIFMVLDTFRQRGILADIEELDFRSRNVVFTMKEEE